MGDPSAVVGNLAQFANPIPFVGQLRDDPHPLRDVEPGAPEVHHVTAVPQARRTLDERRLVSALQEPVGERRARDSGSDDQHPHCDHYLDPLLDQWSKHA
jgi:hypothetical protein